jgi:hypothetical protein
MRGATPVGVGDSAGSRYQVGFASWTGADAGYANDDAGVTFAHLLDSPATTSSTTYSVQCITYGGTTTYVNRGGTDTDSADVRYARGASTITLMEIAG